MNPRLHIGLALVLASAGCGFRPTSEQKLKDPAYVFPHSTHVDADVACTECHAGIAKATKLDPKVRHVAIPPSPSKRSPCSDCHDKDPVLNIPVRSRAPRLQFSHADHLAKVNGDCKRCHRQLTEPGDDRPKIPPMEACTSCHHHQQEFAQARCMPCHVDLKGYEPRTAFRHEGDWLRSHGALARPSAETCAQCHDQTYCAECHSSATSAARPSIIYPERVDRSFIHRGDYVSRHMIDAGANPSSCRTCHGSGFCEACHVQQGLSKFSTGPSVIQPATHQQAGWATSTSGKPLHAHAARRDISSCAGCHDQGASSTCVFCHQVGGIGGNPHPRKFLSKHDSDDRSRNSMCAACHHGA